jgi:hypothetical protein
MRADLRNGVLLTNQQDGQGSIDEFRQLSWGGICKAQLRRQRIMNNRRHTLGGVSCLPFTKFHKFQGQRRGS